MSRVSNIEQLYRKRKSALEFNYDALTAPPIRAFLTQDDIFRLYKIATSVKYAGDIDKKYNLIHDIMSRRGFRRTHAGTNRVVYECMEIPSVVAKIAIDKVGMGDNPKEFVNQNYFKPFCCKIFEVDSTGVIAFVEKVNPITSIEEFASVAEDVFDLIITKIIGKYVLDDIGCDRYMNYGIRSSDVGFGPVIIDFPYAFELDGRKLICNREINTPLGKSICGGEIDYDIGFNNLICTKCGKIFKARDLQLDKKQILFIEDEEESDIMPTRARIMLGDKVIKDSMASTKTYITKDKYDSYQNSLDLSNPKIYVDKVFHKKQLTAKQIKDKVMTDTMIKAMNNKKEEKLPDGIEEQIVSSTKSAYKEYAESEKQKNEEKEIENTEDVDTSVNEDNIEDSEEAKNTEDEEYNEGDYNDTEESDEEEDDSEYLKNIPYEELCRMYNIPIDDNNDEESSDDEEYGEEEDHDDEENVNDNMEEY